LVVASCFGVRDARSGPPRNSLEVFASPSSSRIVDLVSDVVVNEPSLRLVRQVPENVDVGAGHDRAPGSDTGTETTTACGRSVGSASGRRSLKPTALSRLVICWGGPPHSGQAAIGVDAAGV